MGAAGAGRRPCCRSAGREAAPGGTVLDTGQNIAGLRAARGPRRGRDGRDRAPRRGPRARRVPPRRGPAQRPGHGHVQPAPTTARRRSSPRFTFHGFRYAEVETDAELLERRGRRDQQRHAAMRQPSPAPMRGSRGSTRTSSGPSATTSSRSPPTARSATSASAGRVTPRRSRRPARRSSTPRPSGRAGCATWTLEQDDVLGVPSVVPDVVLDGPPGSAGPAGPMRRRSSRGRCYESYGDPRHRCGGSSPACGDGSTRSSRGAASDGLLGPIVPVRRLAGPRRAGRPAVGGQGRLDVPRERVLRPQCPAARPTPPASSATPTRPGTTGALARDVAARTWARWRDEALTTQTGCAAALRLGIAPDDDRAMVGDALARLVRDADGAVATGFLGTPLVLPGVVRHRPPRRGVPDAAAARTPIVALPGGPGRDHGLGAVGRDPSRRLDPSGHDASARRRRRRPGRPHAVVQPLCLRRGDRLGVPPPGRAGARRARRRAIGGCSWLPGRSAASTGRAPRSRRPTAGWRSTGGWSRAARCGSSWHCHSASRACSTCR